MKIFDSLKDGLKRFVSLSDDEDYDDDENYGDDDFDDDGYDDDEPVTDGKKKESEKVHYEIPSPSVYNPPEYGKKTAESAAPAYGFKPLQKSGANLYKMDSKPQSKKLKVTLFVLEDMDDARNVADCMIERGVVTLADMTKLPTESVRRVLDFLDGVKYVCKSKIEVIAEKIYLIVPEAAELSGDFFGQVDKPSFF